MPGMDGFEVCRRLKAVEETRAIPVVILSVLTEVKDVTVALQLGAADYLMKPISNEFMIRTLLKLLENKGAAAAQDTLRPPTSPAE